MINAPKNETELEEMFMACAIAIKVRYPDGESRIIDLLDTADRVGEEMGNIRSAQTLLH